MTTHPAALTRAPLLADVALPRVLTSYGLPVLMGAGLTALAAQIAIPVPGSPVPVTGQTFAVLLTAAALGLRRGLASQALYLVLGLIGLPIFTDASGGIHTVFGATGGYLVGFLLAAAIAGAASQRGADRSPWRTVPVMVVASASIYLTGTAWLMADTGMSLGSAINAGVVPFLAGDALKVLLAAGLLPLAWKMAGGKGSER